MRHRPPHTHTIVCHLQLRRHHLRDITVLCAVFALVFNAVYVDEFRPRVGRSQPRRRKYSSTKRKTRHEVAERRAGMVPRKKGGTMNDSSSAFSIPEVPRREEADARRSSKARKGETDDFERKRAGESDAEGGQIEGGGVGAYGGDSDVGGGRDNDGTMGLEESGLLEELGIENIKGLLNEKQAEPTSSKMKTKGGRELPSMPATGSSNPLKMLLERQEDEALLYGPEPIKLQPKPKPPHLQWKKKDLMQIVRYAHDAQVAYGLEQYRHSKRVPGTATREDIWGCLTPEVRRILTICKIKERVLAPSARSMMESLVMTKDMFVKHIWTFLDANWEKNVERAFDKYAINVTHITIENAQRALSSEALETPIPTSTFSLILSRFFDEDHALEQTSIKAAAEELTNQILHIKVKERTNLKKSKSGIYINFRSFRILCGLLKYLDRGLALPDTKELNDQMGRLEQEKATKEAEVNAVREKYLPICDWSPQRLADHKRRHRKLVDFFLEHGMGKTTLKNIQLNRERRKFKYVEDAVREIARSADVNDGYDRTFKIHFNRGHMRREPKFKEAIMNETAWFVSKGYIEYRKTMATSFGIRARPEDRLSSRQRVKGGRSSSSRESGLRAEEKAGKLVEGDKLKTVDDILASALHKEKKRSLGVVKVVRNLALKHAVNKEYDTLLKQKKIMQQLAGSQLGRRSRLIRPELTIKEACQLSKRSKDTPDKREELIPDHVGRTQDAVGNMEAAEEIEEADAAMGKDEMRRSAAGEEEESRASKRARVMMELDELLK